MWLKAILLAVIGLKLEDEVVRIAVVLRLGADICETHDCVCGAKVSTKGTHGLACKFSAGRHSRHNQLTTLSADHLSRLRSQLLENLMACADLMVNALMESL